MAQLDEKLGIESHKLILDIFINRAQPELSQILSDDVSSELRIIV